MLEQGAIFYFPSHCSLSLPLVQPIRAHRSSTNQRRLVSMSSASIKPQHFGLLSHSSMVRD